MPQPVVVPDRPGCFSAGDAEAADPRLAVRLPKEYRFAGTGVVVRHFGNGVLLLPIDDPWKTLEAGLAAFEPGFVLTREQPPMQERAAIQVEAAVWAYGSLCAELERRSTSIGPLDTMIAAHALSQQALLVTHNTREPEDWLRWSPLSGLCRAKQSQH